MKLLYNNNLATFVLAILITLGLVSTNSSIAQTSISIIGNPYTQNFNTLTSAGAWTDNTTLQGWYAQNPDANPFASFVLNDGQPSTAGLTSFGSIASSDRSLGFAPYSANFNDKMYVGWRLKNNTGQTIQSTNITWTGEQWSSDDFNSQYLVMYYQISASPITAINSGSLESTAFQFESPIIDASGVLDGNNPANRITYSSNIAVAIPAGSEIMIVWEKSDALFNQLLSIDDVTVTAKASQIINFPNLPTKEYGDASFGAGATASSGLTVSYTSDNLNVATISGTTINIVGPGRAFITASQVGNASYTAASNVTKTLNVRPKIPVTTEATGISTTGFQANWTADNGLTDASTTYVIQIASNPAFTGQSTYLVTPKFRNFTALTPNTIYYYKVYARNTGNVSSYNLASAITTGTNYVSVNNGSWDTGANWDVGYINDIANSIKVLHTITLSTFRESVTTNTLWITSTGKLTTNQKIHVTNQLIIEVDANGNSGQILNTANIEIGLNAKIIVRKTFAANQWNFMGFPFNIDQSTIYAQGGSSPLTWGDLGGGGDYVVQEYSGSQRAATSAAEYVGAGLNWINVPSRQFVAKKGHIIATATARTIDFTVRGENKADIFSISGASATLGQYPNILQEHRSWNLVTSPYFSSFDLAQSPTNAPYYAYNGVNYLPALSGTSLIVKPFASFFLQASSPSMSFANAGKRTNVLAAKDVDADFEEVKLILTNGNSLYDDRTIIRLEDDASMDYIIGKDASKLFGMDPNVSYIYSTINGYGVAINTLPRTVTSVDLRTKFAAAGNYSISISDTDKLKSYSAVVLFDKVTNKSTDLLAVGSYDYNASAAGTFNRFKVILTPKVSTGLSVSDDNKIQIISKVKAALISGLEQEAYLTVYDMSGKIVFSNKINDNEVVDVRESGLYLFVVTTKDKTIQIKSFIK